MKTKIFTKHSYLPLGIDGFALPRVLYAINASTTKMKIHISTGTTVSASQNDSYIYYDEDNEIGNRTNNLGFSYYYPGWQSYWSWDYGCVIHRTGIHGTGALPFI
jgi:hypothetical protein